MSAWTKRSDDEQNFVTPKLALEIVAEQHETSTRRVNEILFDVWSVRSCPPLRFQLAPSIFKLRRERSTHKFVNGGYAES